MRMSLLSYADVLKNYANVTWYLYVRHLINRLMKVIAQLPIEPHLFKYAIKSPNFNDGCFNVPFSFTLPVNSNYRHHRDYFNKITNDPKHKILLVYMHKPTPARLFALNRWLFTQFMGQMHQLLIAARALAIMEKDTILQYLECFDINEHDYAIGTALKSWDRKKAALRTAGQGPLIDFPYNELRKTPKPNKQSRDMPDLDIQDL